MIRKRISLALLAVIASCGIGENARQFASWPQVRASWPAVRQDVERGFAAAAPGEVPPTSLVTAMDAAVTVDTLTGIRSVDWQTLEPWAQRGIDATGYSDGVKDSLREQLANFHTAVLQIQRLAP